MSLYNCKCDGDQYRISKFTNDLDVEASYLTDGAECDCPAGHRPICRHRIMLLRFIAKDATAGQFFHVYETNAWIRARSDDEPDTLGDLASAASELTTYTITDHIDTSRIGQTLNIEPKPINLLELAKPTAEPLRFDKDHSNSIGNSPAHDALPPKPLRRL